MPMSTTALIVYALAAENDPDGRHRLVAVVVQAVRNRRLEADRVARAEHVLLEAERHAQLGR